MSIKNILINYVLVIPNIKFLNNYWSNTFMKLLLPIDRNMADATHEAALVNKTLAQARVLFNIRAQNTQ